MLRNNTLRLVIIGLAIIFVILLTFAYGNYLRQQKSNQKQPSNQSVQDSGKNKPADKNTAKNQADHDKKADRNGKDSVSPPPANQPPVSQPTNQAASTPTTGAGEAILPLSILSLLTVEYIRVRRRRSLQVSRSKLE